MSENNLLQLSEYSNKYGVSLSTLRRRIKAGEIEFQFDQGKYWLLDTPIARYVRNRPQNVMAKELKGTASMANNEMSSVDVDELNMAVQDMRDFTASAKSMMAEMKSAFIKALQEKEEQILELKDEVADLRTLNRILDQENERLKKSSFPEWRE